MMHAIAYRQAVSCSSNQILEKLLKDEEEHAADLTDLLYIVNPETGETEGQDQGTEPLRLRRRQDGAKTQQSASRSEEQQSSEAHRKERARILKELRGMGEKKKKPAA